MINPIAIIGSVIEGVSGYFGKKQEIKKVKAVAESKLALKKVSNDHEVTLSDAEWEAIGQKGLTDSWKDEYITIIITIPIPGIIVGAVWKAFTGNDALLNGVLDGVGALSELGLDWKTMTLAVVFAAIGLKMWRAK
jgi:hypothetical protein